MKKNLDLSIEAKRSFIEAQHPKISIERQCELIGLNRSSYYYQPRRESDYNEYLMQKLDELYTETPFYGARRMTAVLKQQGENVNVKRVRPAISNLECNKEYRKESGVAGQVQKKAKKK